MNDSNSNKLPYWLVEEMKNKPLARFKAFTKLSSFKQWLIWMKLVGSFRAVCIRFLRAEADY